MKYESVIGIEVHVELNTKTKMFCRCSADYFGKAPNTHTCPVCLGLPGALPYINEEAIKKCMQIGLALNCKVNKTSLFERKNYFYPDLSKGYQISQYRYPLCIDGKLILNNGKVIRINRAHQEEDTGKLTHQIGGSSIGPGAFMYVTHTESLTFIDFNRSGVPLVEVVTEPDFSSSEEVKEYAQKLQQIFKHLGVSNADMERGDMRLEANVSIRPVGQTELPPYRVELKNINSFRFMVAAIEYEIKRQIEELEQGRTLHQETRGWNEAKKETYLQRSKEEAHDYRYFPEPDLPELKVKHLEEEIGEQIKGKLPQEKINYLVNTYGISGASGATIVTQGMAEYFDKAAKLGQQEGIDPRGTANYLINKRMDLTIPPEKLITDLKAKTTGIVSDDRELEELAKQAVNENPKAAEDFKSGKENAIQVLVGGVMKLSKGKADANVAGKILKKMLE